MSLSITLLPYALALRVIMGKENFARWLESNQVRVRTFFDGEDDLVRTVKLAGYDCQQWGGIRKTHLRGDKQFFLWELIDGHWYAVFSKADAQAPMRQIIEDLESKSGRRLFQLDAGLTSEKEEPRQSFPTNFRDGALLLRTLQMYGAGPVMESDGSITCSLGEATARFIPGPDGPFSVELEHTPNLQPVFGDLSELDGEYKRGVQAAVYERLKRRISDQNLTLESEEVLDDNSILLTLTVNE